MDTPAWLYTCPVAPDKKHVIVWLLVPQFRDTPFGRHIQSQRCQLCDFDPTDHIAVDRAEKDVPPGPKYD